LDLTANFRIICLNATSPLSLTHWRRRAAVKVGNEGESMETKIQVKQVPTELSEKW
jgi:hypothetical protein